MSSSEDDLSTTSGSVTDSDEESAGPSDKGLDSTRASAREEFQRMTRETDAKNAALQRDGGSSDSESSSTADSDDGAPPQKGRSESKAADSSGSDSETESSVSVGAASPSASGSGGRVVQGQHHDEELEMRCVTRATDTRIGTILFFRSVPSPWSLLVVMLCSLAVRTRLTPQCTISKKQS